MSGARVPQCAACRADLDPIERIGRRDTCPRCGADLHACRQCRFHDPRAANQCHEPQAERVLDKERGNFCDYFAPRVEGTPDAAPPASRPGAGTRDELDRLFRRR
jgi:hypothetical protein